MKYLVTLTLTLFLLMGCSSEESPEMTAEMDTETTHQLFFANLMSLCGERFTGGSTFPDDPDHDLVDTELNAHVSSCEENKIEVDLYRDGDTWHATWVLEQRAAGLHLYHDHVGDQDEEELGEDHNSGYGGYADDRGSDTRQYFPADEYTAEIIPDAVTNVWMMDMDLENGTLVYYLERHQEPRFRAELTRVTQ